MLSRWGRAISHLSLIGLRASARVQPSSFNAPLPVFLLHSDICRGSLFATATEPASHGPSSQSEVSLHRRFWSKPCSLALPPDSPLRIEDPKYEGLRKVMLKLLLFYSKQSTNIRGANVLYSRIISQVDSASIYDVFHLEKTFKTTFSLLVLHMWLCLRRLKDEGKEGTEFGQYFYEIYNHDLELRVSKAGVNLLLVKWMKELEKIFYGNIVSYDAAMLPDAANDELPKSIWRNVFSDDGTPMPNGSAADSAQVTYFYFYF
ncbi:Ubiquinol-cytochrome-c reductase complex assembly factor 1 [Nymphaea thermarum]|nr:Ubiquinol-cytochrome-c reductase complex assembly factor 1 [Nymphaea thermarum]